MRFDTDPLRKRWKEERVVKRFLWIPVTLYHERRWLEFADILQRVESKRVDIDGSWYRHKIVHFWKDIEFV